MTGPTINFHFGADAGATAGAGTDAGTATGTKPGPGTGGGRAGKAGRAAGDTTGRDAADTAKSGAKAAGKAASTGVAGVKGLTKAQVGHGVWIGEKMAGWVPEAEGWALLRTSAKAGGRALPFIGNALSLGFAFKDFREGDVIGGLLGVLGAVPGIGYVGIGLNACWELWGKGRYGSACGTWDAPDAVRTFMLPAAAAAGDANVGAFDAALTGLQKEVFGFQDGPTGTVWTASPPPALRVDTGPVKDAIGTWATGIATTVAEIDRLLAGSDEPYMLEARTRLQTHLAAMAQLPQYGRQIETQLSAASDAAGTLYRVVIDSNAGARSALASSGHLGGGDFTESVRSCHDGAQRSLAEANKQLAAIGASQAPPPLAAVGRQLPHQPTAPAPQLRTPAMSPTPQLAPAAPLTPPPPAATLSPEKKGDSAEDISKFLSGLRSATPTIPTLPTPQVPQMPNLGGIPMGGQPVGQSPQPKPPAAEAAPQPKLAVERPSLSASPAENKTVPAAASEKKADTKPEENKTAAAPASAPAASVPAPAASGGDTAPAAAKPAATKPEDHTVDVKGKKITFPDAKTAALAKELSAGTPGAPANLADAATKAGLVPPVPGQDPGQQVAPADAKPGDLLRAGGKDYMLLGKGEFLDFSNGKVLSADTLPKDLGGNGGYFHLHDAAAGAVPGPVSAPVPDITAFTVDQHPKVPADADVAAHPAATGGAHDSAGSPGVPAKGDGTGPANAAATDTGRGIGTPAPSTKPLDPTAIK